MSGQIPPKSRKSRFLAGLPAVLHDAGGDHECIAYNLSRSGVLLEGALPRPAGSTARATLRTVRDDLRLTVEGRIARVSDGDEADELRLALEFTATEGDASDTLDALVARVVEGMMPAALERLGNKPTIEETRQALALIPLAHRMTLAARVQARERELLLQDDTPQVLEALVRNPGVTLVELKNLARGRDLLATTIELMARDPRWGKDEELKILLATHPKATLALAEKIAASLDEIGVRKLIQRAGLHPAVRRKLLERLSKQRAKTW